MTATLGKYAFGFTWGAWAAMFLATAMLLLGCMSGRSERATTASSAGKWQVFHRGRSTRKSARGSFIDTESQHRVKDEYS